MRQHLLTLVALAFAASISLADKIYLNDGRVIEGTIVSQSETEIKIDIGKNGAKITFPMGQVKRIERTAASPEQLYKARLLVTDRTSPDQLVGLADWCVANRMEARGAEHFVEALKLQPDHARARGRLAELGYKEVEGKWLSKAEQEALANPPKEEIKPEVPKGPTSADVARDFGKWVLAVNAGKLAGVGVWASAEGVLWVAGPAAAATADVEVDLGGQKAAAQVLVRDRLRGLALWKADAVGLPAPRPSYATLPDKDPLVALSPGGIVADVFARGWENPAVEVWRIRLEGPAGGAAIFTLDGKLVGLSGDGRGAVGMFDLARMLLARAPAPEGAQNAGGSYWRATDLAEGPALEMIRAGSRLETFEPGLGRDEMNRASALAVDLQRLGTRLGGSIDDQVAAVKVARHCARAGRLSFGRAAAEIIRARAVETFSLLPRLTPIQAARLRAALDGLGPDPAGLESSAAGELARAEAIVFATKDIRSEIDLQIAAFPFLGPEPIESLDAATSKMYETMHAEREFAASVRSACARPDPTRAEELRRLGAGPGAFADFPALRDRALTAMTALTAARLALRLREVRAEEGAYPKDMPAGYEDPATGAAFELRPDGDGFTLVSPGGEQFRLRE
ncbi:MAG: hypothetical protein HYY18_01835 [Planctomycetes bacterium]|nr:hypothetical protein [Planctomycetota bacterium]